MQLLDALEISHSKNPDSTVIWLHGLGANGYDFEPVVQALNLPATRFVLPHAPTRPITINNGYSMPGWYDLYGLEAGSPQDESGIREAQNRIEAFIENEVARGIEPRRIVLAGFSQGGAIALHTALRYRARMAGVMGLSTYLPLKSSLMDEAEAANRDLPVFIAHGTFDNVIPLNSAQASVECLQQRGYSVTWREYPMAHSVCMEEIADIRDFLQSVLK
ncbi:MAG TPA: alpha/beta fold hydrolase [Methylophilaceae bacterium]|nr:alpha/beta fold hydrolase [Methylophilaceae bacterium]